MTRILVPTLAAVLALGVYFWVRSSGSPEEAGPGHPGAENGTKSGSASAPEVNKPSPGSDTIAKPIRMRSSTPTKTEGLTAPVAAADSLADAFAAEERDPLVADAHNELIRSVVTDLAELGKGTGHIEKLECHRQHCMLRLASENSEGLVKLVDALQDERGFLGKTESLMLSRDEDDIIFYLRFAPPK